MNQRTILERRVLGLSDGDPSRLATLSDGLKIGAGDRIVSRANDHQVRGPDGHRIENGMAFTVTRIDTDAIACRDADGRQWTIPGTGRKRTARPDTRPPSTKARA